MFIINVYLAKLRLKIYLISMTVVRHFIIIYNTHCMVISCHLHGPNFPPLMNHFVKLQNIIILINNKSIC